MQRLKAIMPFSQDIPISFIFEAIGKSPFSAIRINTVDLLYQKVNTSENSISFSSQLGRLSMRNRLINLFTRTSKSVSKPMIFEYLYNKLSKKSKPNYSASPSFKVGMVFVENFLVNQKSLAFYQNGGDESLDHTKKISERYYSSCKSALTSKKKERVIQKLQA